MYLIFIQSSKIDFSFLQHFSTLFTMAVELVEKKSLTPIPPSFLRRDISSRDINLIEFPFSLAHCLDKTLTCCNLCWSLKRPVPLICLESPLLTFIYIGQVFQTRIEQPECLISFLIITYSTVEFQLILRSQIYPKLVCEDYQIWNV